MILDRVLIKCSVVVHYAGRYIGSAFLWNHPGAGGDEALRGSNVARQQVMFDEFNHPVHIPFR